VATISGSVPAAPGWKNSIWAIGQTAASISWTDNSNDESGFRIYNEADTRLTDQIPAKDGSGDGVSYRVSGLECGTVNKITIVAYNGHGESRASDPYSIRTALCDNVPPTAKASASPMQVNLGESVTFTCEGNDTDGTIEKYRWIKGSNVVAKTASLSTSDFSVGDNTYKCQVTDDRGDTGVDSITIKAISDEATAYATVSPDSITVGERASLECLGNDTRPRGIQGYQWYRNDTATAETPSYRTPTNLPEGNYTYRCKITYDDGATAEDSIELGVESMDVNLESINLSQDFEGFAVGEYNASNSASPIYYADNSLEHPIQLNFFGIVDRGNGKGKAFCIRGHATGTKWKDIFKINIPGLDATHKMNVAGVPTLKFEYKETYTAERHGVTWLNLFDRIDYSQGKGSSSRGGGVLIPNVDPGIWQASAIENFGFTFNTDDPETAGTYYDIKAADTSKEITSLAVQFTEGSSKNIKETIDFCIDNVAFTGTQMKQEIFDEEYGAVGGYKRWGQYTDRINNSKLSDIKASISTLPALPSCNAGLSTKRDYQCHKLVALKRHIDYVMEAIEYTKRKSGKAFFKEDIRRIEEALARYKATYTMFNTPPPENDFVAYRVPAMKYGRLDGFTFPMVYASTSANPYDNITMAKGEYRSIAILLDPGKGYNQELTFTNTAFSNGGGISLDKYIAPVWYQSGKNNSVFDSKIFHGIYGTTQDLHEYVNDEGNAWITQELLLKNSKLIKIERDSNEKNLIFYKGRNLLYTTGKAETLGDGYGVVPGYVQISTEYSNATPARTPYDILGVKGGKNVRVSTRYNLRASDPDLLAFDDNKTIQPFTLKDEYVLLWAIIHIDEGATTGTHTATIEIKKGGSTVKSIPITINVSDYKLAESVLDYGIYYHGIFEGNEAPHSVSARPATINKSPKQVQLDLKDMYEHGLRYPICEQSEVNTRVTKLMDYLTATGFPGKKYFSWIGKTFARPATNPEDIKALQDLMRGHAHFTDAQLYIGIPDEAPIAELSGIRRYIRDVIRGNTWKDKLNVKTWGGAFKDAVDILATGGYLDAPVINASRKWLIQHQLEKFHKGEKDEHGNDTDPATTYKYGDPQTGVENPEIYRRNFGISMYQEGYTGGGMDYAYQKQYGFYWNDFDLAYTFEKNHREEAFTYPTTGLVAGGKGYVGTIQWEGYREAITDMRYLSTLLSKKTNDNSEEIDRFIMNLDVSKGKDLDAVRQQIINKIELY
jgi:hypothetical protein